MRDEIAKVVKQAIEKKVPEPMYRTAVQVQKYGCSEPRRAEPCVEGES